MNENELFAFLKELEGLLTKRRTGDALSLVRQHIEQYEFRNEEKRLSQILDTLDISPRTRNALLRDYHGDFFYRNPLERKWRGIDIEHLEDIPDEKFLTFTNFGPVHLQDIRSAFQKKSQK